MDLELHSTQAKGGKMKMEMKMMGQTMQKITFDGKDGKIEAQGKSMPIPDKEKAKMMADTEIFPELTFAKSTTAKLSGIEKFENEDCYVVKDQGSTYYYSVKSGLKLGEVKEQSKSVYSNYKEVSGVKFPFTVKQEMGGMEVEFNVKSATINTSKDSDFK